MKHLLAATVIVLGQSATAQSLPDASGSLSLGIPQASGSYQSDSFRANQLDCANAIGSATNLEMGVMGIVNQGGYYNSSTVISSVSVYNSNANFDAGTVYVYASA